MYEDITYDVILQRMLDRVEDKLDKREGSVIYDALSPAAIEFQILYLELDNILKEAYGDSASREYLILRCKERGIEPYQATYAILQGEFKPSSIDVIGQRFNLGDRNYVVTERVAEGIYQVRCETLGTVGNQYLGSMIPMEYIDGLESAELTKVLIPGEEEEDTESLRQRYFNSFHSQAFGGNRQDYIEKVNAVAGVGGVKVVPVWNGDIAPSAMIPGEAVMAWYDSIKDTVNVEVQNWLKSVYGAAVDKKLTTGGTVKIIVLDADYNKASDMLIKEVQKRIDPEDMAGEGMGLAPIGHVVKVDTVKEVAVNIKTTLSFETGYSWSNLQSMINETVEAYLLELRKVWSENDTLTIRISQIETRLLNIKGIVDVTDTRINGLESNLVLENQEIPVLGGVFE